MRKIILVILVLAFAVFSQPVHAQETPNEALVGFKYYNTSTWGMTTKSAYEKIVIKNVAPVLAKNNIIMINNEKYFDKLKASGYSDFTSVEKADMLDIYKDEGFRYLIFIEVDPVRPAAGIGYESSAHIKIIDMQTAKYLFNGKIAQMTKWGGGGTVLEKIGKDIRTILDEKVFLIKVPIQE